MAEDIEEIRKRKLMELQKKYLEQQKAQEEALRGRWSWKRSWRQ